MFKIPKSDLIYIVKLLPSYINLPTIVYNVDEDDEDDDNENAQSTDV